MRQSFHTLWMLLLLGLSTHALADRQQDPELGKLLQQALKADSCFEDKFEQQVWHAAMEPQLRRIVQDSAERRDILYHVHCEAKRLNVSVLSFLRVSALLPAG